MQTEQVSPADSFAGNPSRVQKVAQAPYISPYIHMDVNLDMAVLQIRDSDTGDVVRQIPSDATVEARQREVERRSEMTAPRSRDVSVQSDVAEGDARSASQSVSNRQMAAFETAARSGNSNAGNISLFA